MLNPSAMPITILKKFPGCSDAYPELRTFPGNARTTWQFSMVLPILLQWIPVLTQSDPLTDKLNHVLLSLNASMAPFPYRLKSKLLGLANTILHDSTKAVFTLTVPSVELYTLTLKYSQFSLVLILESLALFILCPQPKILRGLVFILGVTPFTNAFLWPSDFFRHSFSYAITLPVHTFPNLYL